MMKRSSSIRCLVAVTSVALSGVSAFAVPPTVVKTVPQNGDRSVDPGLTKIVIQFDQDMRTEGMSICGGGPLFPTRVGRSKWADKRTLEMGVALQPGHEYRMMLNCPSSQKGFRNEASEPADSFTIRFKTSGVVPEGSASPAPKVLRTYPVNGSKDVVPGTVQIRIKFDQDMNQARCSICGAGPLFPTFAGKPMWEDKRTLVFPAALEPDHEYQLSVNCPSYQNCRSEAGVPAEIHPINFKTRAQ